MGNVKQIAVCFVVWCPFTIQFYRLEEEVRPLGRKWEDIARLAFSFLLTTVRDLGETPDFAKNCEITYLQTFPPLPWLDSRRRLDV
ncbi:hypothetical protein SUGI_0981570 [Cryptomeria japonica]|nr:hypothetical protein SUGI_0981570 [Cryptomeria japonica]